MKDCINVSLNAWRPSAPESDTKPFDVLDIFEEEMLSWKSIWRFKIEDWVSLGDFAFAIFPRIFFTCCKIVCKLFLTLIHCPLRSS